MKRLCCTLASKSVSGGDAVDIAVDPIEGTRMTAMGQSNALAVLAAGVKRQFPESARYVHGKVGGWTPVQKAASTSICRSKIT